MSNICYGVTDRNGGFIELSDSEKGAKRIASREDYTKLYCMHRISLAVWCVAQYSKIDRKWYNIGGKQ